MLNRLKRKIGYCYRLHIDDDGYVDGVETFRSPVFRWLNVLPVSGEMMLANGGELSSRYMKARIPKNHPDSYFEGDRVYIDQAIEPEFDPISPNANYVIRSVLPGHSVTEILFERLVI